MSRTRFVPLLVVLMLVVVDAGMAQPSRAERLPGPSSRPSTSVGRSTERVALQQLEQDLDAIISDGSFVDATWGISIVSCETGEQLYGRNERQNRQVASNIKLLTTATALQRLGSDYRFGTTLYMSGKVGDNGVLNGDLVIRASGDPSISPTFGVDPQEMIRGWAHVLDSLGIRVVRNVVVDASLFDAVQFAPGWAWDDEPFGFNAPISAAAIYDNSITVTVTPGRAPGRSVLIDISPATAYVTLKVTAVTSRPDSASTLDIRRERGDLTIEVGGNIAAGAAPYTETISIEDPAVFFGTLVQEELVRAGIGVEGIALDASERSEKIDYRTLRPLAVHYSPPLREIVASTNKQSLNLSAEMLLKKVGREASGAGSTASGLEIVRSLLSGTGIDIDRVRLYDGSGLSRQDMIAPGDVTRFLRWARRASIGADYLASLPIAGRDGTLAKRMIGTLAENNVIAKTGYMNGVRAISGYARSRDGEWLAFSIIANNYSVPTSVVNTAQDLILMRLASFSRRS
jgi:D-alanyl-D-alanine carboxypeptidase/D-alanyl-D-alanine-endopeptidase (penicillin-binding protein 4)